MDNNIVNILGEGTLPPELAASLQDAFDQRVAAAREQAELAVREELAQRYEHDKSNLVEALDRMLSEVTERQETEKAAAITRLVEARKRARTAIGEARQQCRVQLAETRTATRQFVTERLRQEVAALRAQKRALAESKRVELARLDELKNTLAQAHGKRLRKIDEFVIRQVDRELRELMTDHKALLDTRVKLVREARVKLRETQNRFVKGAAVNIEKLITETLAREMSEMHEELERNRQNMFGRRIFEAVAAEYLTSYLAEGSEIRRLASELDNRDQQLVETRGKLDEAQRVHQSMVRKTKLAEDRVQRSRVMNELLSPLRGEKRRLMENLLETTATVALKETYGKLLPMVLDDATRAPHHAIGGRSERAPASGERSRERAVLTEARTDWPATVVTGEQRSNRLREAPAADEASAELANVIRLAGIGR